MHRDELLKELLECIRTEESASAIYLEHLHALAERAGIEQMAVVKKIQEGISGLIRENKRHKHMLEQLRKMIADGDKDDW